MGGCDRIFPYADSPGTYPALKEGQESEVYEKEGEGKDCMEIDCNWWHKPYLPVYNEEKRNAPYICRLAPNETGFEAEWFDLGSEEQHMLYWQHISWTDWKGMPVSSNLVKVGGLKKNEDYRFFIESKEGRKSHVRLVRTGMVPGVVVNYIHPRETQYIYSGAHTCSPSLLKLPNGVLLASHDVYQKDGGQNLTILYRSYDGGAHWHFVTELFPCWWGRRFWHDGKVYCFGVSTEYGDLLLGCSHDEGETWTGPIVLGYGACCGSQNGFQKAPFPVITYGERLWTMVEFGSWSTGEFCYLIFSAAIDSNLMCPKSWIATEPLKMNYREWGCNEISDKLSLGYDPLPIEGNLVVTPEGSMKAILRFTNNYAVLLGMDFQEPERALWFENLISFPMAHSKFEIRKNEEGRYIALGNSLPRRNILSMYSSDDLRHWEWEKNILDFSGEDYDGVYTGVQYPSFFMERNEVSILIRAALNRADNFHDANYLLFCRTKRGRAEDERP